jgi:hypothetical protein
MMAKKFKYSENSSLVAVGKIGNLVQTDVVITCQS